MASQSEKYLSTDNQGETDDSGQRPRIKSYAATSKFRPGDKVYLAGGEHGLLGPYLVAAVAEPQKYTLCNVNDGVTAENGRVVHESELSLA
ncbi:hypothetical protein F4777DRAFT_544978 [Nemania sp. FL0916]|nr:hypothetical protein F4777DRAFT_544978 [Nemania sp. FL0916]